MTTALYRRYRPETFEDVIGQEHVTEPLMTALRKDRVSHAYLFSGPRGCGKTTSARILARCLNCAEGPTATPCGRCDSCRDLARDGAGSLDVIEMDAASHGGVDHARDLRERATFAPVRDRYKIFIIDEAHMVTREGFNALLKIVEEPPEHIKFIFATTEPSKVLTTIRSRTHHYPFRLVPTEPLMHYLEQLCAEEQVRVAPGVLSLVVRAGAGSVRDTLSVLDQLMAGSDERGIGYDLAVALLGYTHGALLDDVVDAFASGDAATVFRAVDRVVQTGQDPRRFVEDLLERFRDLIIVNAVPESAGNILHGMPQDQIARLRNQASQLGAAELSRAADITNTALTEMTGATSPQLHLELLCARVLLPSSEDTTRGVTARVDRLERRLSIGRPTTPAAGQDEPPAAAAPSTGTTGTSAAAAGPVAAPGGEAQARSEPTDAPAAQRPAHHHPDPAVPGADARETDAQGAGRAAVPERGDPRQHAPREQPAPAEQPADDRPLAGAEQTAGEDVPRGGEAGGNEIDLLRASWPEIVNALADIRRVAWFTVQRGTPQSFDGKVLRIMFDAEGDLMNFPRFEDDLRQAVQQILGIDCRAEAVPPGGGHGRGGGGGGAPRGPGPSPGPTEHRNDPRPEAEGPGSGKQAPGARTPGGTGPAGRPAGPRGRDGQRADSRAASTPGRGAPTPAAEPVEDARPQGGSRDEQGGNRDGQDPWTAHGRPATDAPPEWTDPAWAEEPVHSWSVATIPQGGTPPEAPAAVPAESPSRSSARHADQEHHSARHADQEHPPERPADRAHASEDAAGPQPAQPPASRPAPQPVPHPTAQHGPRPDPGAAGRSVRGPAGAAGPRDQDVPPPDDDVPPPEEPPHPDEPPYPDEAPYPDEPGDPDEAPPEQWRPAPRDPPPGAARGLGGPRPGDGAAASSDPGPAGRRTVPAAPADAAGTATAPPAPRTAPPATGPADAHRSARLSFRERHAAAIAAGRKAPGTPADPQESGVEWDDSFVPSSDDEALEDSTLYGRAAIERLLGGMLIEERDLHTGE